MTPEEQQKYCEKCEYHKIISAGLGDAEINIMSCHYGDYRNHPVWGDFKCPQGKGEGGRMSPLEIQRKILQRDITDREKIIALVEHAKQYHASDVTDRTENKYIADILLDCGVTIATDTNVGDKWVSVDEPPTKEGWYHVAILDMKTGKYRVENDLYAIEIARMHNHEPGFCKAKSWPERDKLTHWCPYPQPPKEVHHA